MKVLIVYYSKTGNTKIIANELASLLKSDIEEIIETNPKTGLIGMFSEGKDAIFQKTDKDSIKDLQHKLTDYDVVIIGSPVWAWTLANAVRAFIEKYKQDFKQIAFFATFGGTGYNRALSHVEKLSGKSPIASISVTELKIKKKEFKPSLEEFSKKLSEPIKKDTAEVNKTAPVESKPAPKTEPEKVAEKTTKKASTIES